VRPIDLQVLARSGAPSDEPWSAPARTRRRPPRYHSTQRSHPGGVAWALRRGRV